MRTSVSLQLPILRTCQPRPVRRCPWLFLLALVGLGLAARGAGVRVSEQDIRIPTYLAGEPEPNPMFYFGRQSQGAEGRVYPYPLYDTLTSVKSNKTYRIVYLENEYVRIGVLPEIGGRLFEGVDKSNGYDFIYRQHVVKPALIGLIGAWMSGGIEWNIPHHHRATTFLPVQHRVADNPDGSKTVWVGELELRHRMRWAVGYTLHPGRSYLQCSIRILNRTPLPQTLLCFANVAVHVNEQYQVIFPPRTQFVTHHHKREFTTWPIATTRYGGYDFSRGIDVSWYSNHVAANSMFAWNYEDDFFAGYDHGKRAGLMSVADHHMVPGKKLWTWGTGPRGRMWDKILTDDDGPYIELMVGAYSDNQPDYSWLQPFETKAVDMYWYPFREIGGVKEANLDAAVNLEATNGIARIGFATTQARPNTVARLTAGQQVLFEQPIKIDPTRPYVKEVALPAGVDPQELRASLSVKSQELVAYSPVRLSPGKLPDPIKTPPAPKEVGNVEELFLAGQRIDQFHNAEQDPEPYWEEGLSRDPGDVRLNLALGQRQFRQLKFAEAERHFRKALERLTANYTSPRDGEPFYALGLALKAQGKIDEAVDAFAQAAWSQAWKAPAHFALAEIETRRGDLDGAMKHIERSLAANAINVRSLALQAALLRHRGQTKDARIVLELATRGVDPLDARLMAERWLCGEAKAKTELRRTFLEHPATALETASEYGNAGLWADGATVLRLLVDASPDPNRVSPLAYYYLGHFAERMGDANQAARFRHLAAAASPEYCFPFQWEALHVLRRVMEVNPNDARAPYYLGNLLFDGQPAEATQLWERSATLDPSFPLVHRNLAVAYAHQQPSPDLARAAAELERAVAAPQKYARHFTELDELYADLGKPPRQRLALLEQNHETVLKRDDALSREVGLKVVEGKYDEAIQLMTGRKFSVWEGGSLEVADHWVNAHVFRGHQRLQAGDHAAALADFEAARNIPDNLPSDQRGSDDRRSELCYWIGLAHQGLGAADKSTNAWREAVDSTGPEGRGRRGESGGGRGSQACYRAMAQLRLGQDEPATAALRELVKNADAGQSDNATESASSLQAARRQRQRMATAHFNAGLAHLALGEAEPARAEFQRAVEGSPDHPGANAHLRWLNHLPTERRVPSQ